jgi:uncharacterized protein YcgI (DUF1989 family)
MIVSSSPPRLPPGERAIIAARTAVAVLVRAGETLRVIDVEGQQVADVVFASLDDPSDVLSGIVTTQFNKAIYPSIGMVLYSASRRPMFTIVGDTVGRHDLLMGACSAASYELRYGVKDHPNCQTLLRNVLAPLGIHTHVPSTFNAFMNVPAAPDGTLTVETPLSKAGDYVDLRAEIDCFVGVAACPADLSPCNGWNPTAIAIELMPAP